MRAASILGLCLSLSACKSKDDSSAGPAPSTVRPTADTFCERVMGAPLAGLKAKCGPAGDGGPASPESPDQSRNAVLSRHVGMQIDACKRMLEPSMAAGRLTLPDSVLGACSKTIEAQSWKESLTVRGVSWYLANDKTCSGAMLGNQGQGAPCQLNIECKQGLSCRVDPGRDEGTCLPAPGASQACNRPRFPGLAPEARAACATGLYCNFETVTEKAYATAKYAPGTDAVGPSVEGAFLDEELSAPIAARPGSGADAAAANMWGDAIGDAFGDGGLGLSGVGNSGGRGEGIGLGDIGTLGHGAGTGTGQGFGSGGRLGGRGNPPKVRMGATTVSGRLPPEVIQRIVRQNFGRFRLCYENGLRGNPQLEGRVVIRFVIGRDGAVTNVAGSGDLPDKAVVACIQRAFHGLSFPQPEGGIVTVSYPLLLSPGDGTPKGAGATGGTKPDPTRAGDAAGDTPAGSASASASASPPTRGPTDAKNVCLPLIAEGGACWESWQCADGLACRNGKCFRGGPTEPGAACQDHVDCAAGHYCEGTCKARKKTGDACRASVECQGACGHKGSCIALCEIP